VDAQSETPSTPPAASRNQRDLRNYLLEPSVQIRPGIYAIVLGTLFVVGCLGVLYAGYVRVLPQLLDLTEEKDAVQAAIAGSFRQTSLYLLLLSVLFMVCTVAVSVVYTHRLVGPTYAFRRHLRSLRLGHYEVRTILRKDDAFADVAQDLNDLAAHLEQTRGASAARPAAEAAAEAADRAAGADEPAAAP
jgi:hypothetical protein